MDFASFSAIPPRLRAVHDSQCTDRKRSPKHARLLQRHLPQMVQSEQVSISMDETKCEHRRVNHFTGAIYDVPRPQSHGFTILEPKFEPWRKALDMISKIHQAFANFSNDFRVELLTIFPLFGDFKITQISTGIEIIVEIKADHCVYAPNKEIPHMRHSQLSMGFTNRHIFTWKTQWDFLYTTTTKNRQQALFLPRDLIPPTWWNATPDNSGGTLEWPSTDVDILKDYTVDLASDYQLVTDIERVLCSTKRQRTSMKPQRSVPSAVRHVEPPTEVCVEGPNHGNLVGRAEDIVSRSGLNPRWRRWSSSQYQRGFGSNLHEQCRGKSYELWAAEALTELFRRRFVSIYLFKDRH